MSMWSGLIVCEIHRDQPWKKLESRRQKFGEAPLLQNTFRYTVFVKLYTLTRDDLRKVCINDGVAVSE